MHRIPPDVDLSLRDLLQSQNLETTFFCTVVLCVSQNNIAGIHLCDEYTKSIDSSVFLFYKLQSIL